MRFYVSPPERITDEMLQQVYLAGFDQVPWVVHATRGSAADANCAELILRRTVSDSANFFTPWPVADHGIVTVSTGSLMEREEPYHLPLELARGTISRLRNQITEWQAHGLMVQEDVFQGLATAQQAFRGAIQYPHGSVESAAAAEKSLKTALDSIVALALCYTDQASNVRRHTAAAAKILFGAELGNAVLDGPTARSFAVSFNAARVPLPWCDIESSEGRRRWELADRQIAWCKANGLAVCAGPLIEFDRHGLPDWLYLFEGDFESLVAAITEFAEAAVVRYRDRVDFWLCASRANTADVLDLGEEEFLRITAELVERTKNLSPQTPLIVSLDQPWVEYAARRQVDVPPLHFADLLIRADLGLSGIMLEINMGYQPGGTYPRDIVEFSRQLDIWAGLEMPIYLSLCTASQSTADDLARRQVKTIVGGGSTTSQETWIARYVPLAMAKPYVQGVFWNQLLDGRAHDFPHGGLFDRQGRSKPSLAALASIHHPRRIIT